MKIVINTCFGGFSLSDEAFELLLQKKGVEYEKLEAKRPYGNAAFDFFHKGHAGDGEYFLCYYDFCNFSDRNDPVLVEVVEELGEKANGWAAELKVVDVPDDVDWYISEYDGIEHVAEKHRIWN